MLPSLYSKESILGTGRKNADGMHGRNAQSQLDMYQTHRDPDLSVSQIWNDNN